jgi:quercetin dioxygenase-like cupin family protein
MKPLILLTLAAVLGPASAGASEKLGYPARELLATSTDVLGQSIAYPSGTPRVTSAIVTIAPGAEGQLHRHQVPMYAYVLQGVVTVDYGQHGTKVFKQGDAIIEALHVPHKGMNRGTEPVALLVVYMGAEGTQSVTPAE